MPPVYPSNRIVIVIEGRALVKHFLLFFLNLKQVAALTQKERKMRGLLPKKAVKLSVRGGQRPVCLAIVAMTASRSMGLAR
jgi:hypothetical protein